MSLRVSCIAVCLVLGACLSGEASMVESSAITATSCTSVSLTAPTVGFSALVGVGLSITGSATCASGSVPEYQYWAKPAGAANWTIVSAFVPGSFSWVPEQTGDWCVTAVARAAGTGEATVRASARCGVIDGISLTPPSAAVRVSVPLHLPSNGPVIPAQTLSTTGGPGSGLVVQLPVLPVGAMIQAIEARVKDSTVGPTTSFLGFADQVDGGFQEPAIGGGPSSSGTGAFETISVTGIDRLTAPLHTYYAGVFVSSGDQPVSVSAIDVIYVPPSQ